jgi:SAM-dependent methyltransferase
LDISIHHGDMRQPPWHEEFDAAFCVGGSFGYFDDDENQRFIKSVYDTLKPGGRFLVFCHVAESLFPMFRKRDWSKIGENIVLDDRSYDIENNRINSEWTIIQDNETTVQYSSMRIYRYSDMRDMFKDAGFGDLKAYGSVEGEPFEFRSKRLYLVGVK